MYTKVHCHRLFLFSNIRLLLFFVVLFTMVDESTRKTLQSIPLLQTKASPRDKEWTQRLKEEYLALIKVRKIEIKLSLGQVAHIEIISQYVEKNKASDCDWFRLESNKEGTKWMGKCWHVHELLKYEFEIEFDVNNKFTQTGSCKKF